MTPFDDAFAWMIPHEGGSAYSNDPQDPGGETKWGISKRAHPDVDIKNLTEDQARAIYRAYYWAPINGDKVANVSQQVAMKLFDSAVNMGVHRGIVILQQSLNDMGATLTPDGMVGPATLLVLSQAIEDMPLLKRVWTGHLRDYYMNLNKPRFIKGWIRRAESWPS